MMASTKPKPRGADSINPSFGSFGGPTSVARRLSAQWALASWLCVPAFRRVCLCRDPHPEGAILPINWVRTGRTAVPATPLNRMKVWVHRYETCGYPKMGSRSRGRQASAVAGASTAISCTTNLPAMHFTHAIVRPPAENFASGITSSGLGAPDLALALKQHEDYCRTLEGLGLSIERLPPDPDFPDSTFVEDAAI